ncbi:MAG TPA: glycosyltransferase, partial [Thermoanaerobaculia bacterium]|nr:glycosyltransferase [Thermoanaerobaculia bacterium]
MRVLFTNIFLTSRTGTEVWVREAVLGLRRRGLDPMVYAPRLGEVAREIRAGGVPVVDDLSQVGVPPDLIHGHHHPQTVEALLRFPGVPAVFVSHDATGWHDAAPLFPRIVRYVAVDEANRDRLLAGGAPEARIRTLLNWVDLERFRPRAEPLPETPRRALVFSNAAREDTHLPAVREACHRAGLEIDVIGAGVGRSVADPEAFLGGYDLIFAKARCALEALATGAAVVLCDYRGLGPMVTSGELDTLRRNNFGARMLTAPPTPEGVLREIGRYDPRDASAVSRRIRETAGLEEFLDRLLALYDEVLKESAGHPFDPEADLRAAAAYVRSWAGPRLEEELQDVYRQRAQLEGELLQIMEERTNLYAELRRLGDEDAARETGLRRLGDELAALQTELRSIAAERAALAAERTALAGELQ